MKKHPLLIKKKSRINIFLILIFVLIGLITSFALFKFIIASKYDKVKDHEAFTRAMEMINHQWEYDSNKHKKLDQNIKLPYYLTSSGKYIGIPYCYGGQTSLNSSNLEGISGFNDALNKGFVPGNINTKIGYVENTVGVDCSGFVNTVFNIKERTSTRTMDKYFKEISIKSLKPMDILNSKGKHVYIYLGKTEKGVMILESTSNGGSKYKDKTVVNFKTNSEFNRDIKNRGYTPMRYKNIKHTNIDKIYDKYDYNNKEKYAYKIINNTNISSKLYYLEDVDYFIIKNNKDPFKLSFREFKNINVTVYNSKEKVEVMPNESVNINLKGDIYIFIKKGKNTQIESSYTFTIKDS
ncbi:MAG: hypothetical protein RR838_01615 [Clostridium sp.]